MATLEVEELELETTLEELEETTELELEDTTELELEDTAELELEEVTPQEPCASHTPSVPELLAGFAP